MSFEELDRQSSRSCLQGTHAGRSTEQLARCAVPVEDFLAGHFA